MELQSAGLHVQPHTGAWPPLPQVSYHVASVWARGPARSDTGWPHAGVLWGETDRVSPAQYHRPSQNERGVFI